MFKRILSLCLVLAMVVFGCGAALASAPVTIRLQGAFLEASDHYYYLPQFIESVRERSNGTVTVVWGAGPEAIPVTELGEALSSGIIELLYVPVSFLASHMPGLIGTNLTDPAVMRESGGVEFMDSVASEMVNARFLCRTANGSVFVLGIGSDVNSISELEGMVMRGTVSNSPLITAVGAETVNIPWADVHQALERNVIGGLAGAIRDYVDNSLGGVVQTIILPGALTSDASLFISNRVWDRLDDVQKEAVMSSAIDWEIDALRYNLAMRSEHLGILQAAGAKLLELPGAEADEYLRRIYEIGWERAGVTDPATTARLREYAGN